MRAIKIKLLPCVCERERKGERGEMVAAAASAASVSGYCYALAAMTKSQ